MGTRQGRREADAAAVLRANALHTQPRVPSVYAVLPDDMTDAAAYPSRVPLRHRCDLRRRPRASERLAAPRPTRSRARFVCPRGLAAARGLPVRAGARLPADRIARPDTTSGDGADDRGVEGARAQPELLRLRRARARDGRRARERGALPRLQDRGDGADAMHHRRDEHGGAGTHLRAGRSRAHDGPGASRRTTLLGLRGASVRRRRSTSCRSRPARTTRRRSSTDSRRPSRRARGCCRSRTCSAPPVCACRSRSSRRSLARAAVSPSWTVRRPSAGFRWTSRRSAATCTRRVATSGCSGRRGRGCSTSARSWAIASTSYRSRRIARRTTTAPE